MVLVLVSAAAWAQSTAGKGQWLHDCWVSAQKANDGTASERDWPLAYIYAGFVAGAAGVMNAADWLNLTNITWAQQQAVVGKYLDDHPEQWNLPAETLVYRALHAVWPGTKAAPYQ